MLCPSPFLVELGAELALSGSYQLYPPAGSTLLAKARSPPSRQLLGESPELPSRINKSKKGTSQQGWGLLQKSICKSVLWNLEDIPRRSKVMRCSGVSRLDHSIDLTQNGLGKQCSRTLYHR